jgi:hypothetical protein
MQNLVDAARLANKQENWYAALAIALTLPDICGRISYPGLTSGNRVAKFFDKYMAHHYVCGPTYFPIVSMTGGDFYALRCAFLHQGEFDLQGQTARKILADFVLISPKVANMHNNLSASTIDSDGKFINGTLQLRVDTFCEEICAAVEAWLTDVTDDLRIQNEINSLGKIKGA